MLIGFSVKNYKSFYDEANLSMMAGIGTEFEKTNTFSIDGEKYLKSLLIYGANSNGKSNLIDALKIMKKIMVCDFSKQESLLSRCVPFKFNEASCREPVEFEITFEVDKTLYIYGFHVLNQTISREYLYHKKTKRKTLLFERTSCSYKDIIIKNKAAFKGMSSLLEQLRDDILFIKFADVFNNEIARAIVNFFKMLNFDNESEFPFKLIKSGEERIDRVALKLLKYADKSIADIALYKDEIEQKKELRLTREFYSSEWDLVGMIDVDIQEYSSSGSNHLRRLLRNIFYVLEIGGIFIADEIHTHLHPMLTRKIIDIFHSSEYNPKNAQLICTVHDVLLLDEDIRRDQIWFIEKDCFGKSSLYSLSDFKNVRKDDDNLKKYLMGVYGAIPEMYELD